MTAAWKLWLWASVFLGAGELLVLGKKRWMLVLASLALGGLGASIVASNDPHWGVQVGVFAAVSAVALLLLRPILRRFLLEDARYRRLPGADHDDDDDES